MTQVFDRRKTLQELEQDDWGEPNFDSHLVQTCHRLRRKPLNEFTVEDLRIMIGQEIGLLRLVPITLEKLEAEPLAKGDCYPGDLLRAILKVGGPFWERHADWLRRTREVVRKAESLLPSLDSVDAHMVREVLEEAKSRGFDLHQ
jgi:uncharacterized protein (UPF0335 family)